jgi:hypothetical protein
MKTSRTIKQDMLCALSVLCLALATAVSVFATEPDEAVKNIYLAAANKPTNIAGIHTFAEPPKGFNPITASDAELATYGFPLRPDKQLEPDHYALWKRAMRAAKIRWNGELEPLPALGHGMMSASANMTQTATAPTGPKHLSTINGSGVSLTNALTKWSSTGSFKDIWTVITVPTAQLPFANGAGCTASTFVSVSLAGIDARLLFLQPGWVVIPELSGGVESLVDCSGNAAYYAYAEWGTGALPFQLNPGDLFYTEVHASGPSVPGWVYLEDLTTLTYGTYTVDPDPSVPLIGNSAQWMVERPCCSGPGPAGTWPLADNIGVSFEGAAVQNGAGRLFYPGSQAGTTYVLTMMDDRSTQNIELVNQGSGGFQGQHSLFFETTGCAYAGGCTP